MTMQNQDLSKLAAELIRWRNEAGMTQESLAVAADTTLNSIQKMEGKGGATKIKPKMDSLIVILTVLDAPRRAKGLPPIDYNYAFRLAGYPEIAMPVEWAMVLREIDGMPTDILSTREGINKAAQEIVNKLNGDTDNEAGQRTSGTTQGSDKDSSQKETSKKESHRPAHGSR